MSAVFEKDPDATLDYSVIWTDWLAEGDSIVNAAAIADDGITLGADALNGSVHTIWLSGGTPGLRYRVTSRVTSAQGRTDDRSIIIVVGSR